MTNNPQDEQERDILIFQMQQRMEQLQAQIDRLEAANADADEEDMYGEMGPEPVKYVELGSGLSGHKDGEVLSMSATEFDQDDFLYHFKIIANIGDDARTSGNVTIVNGTWTRNATTAATTPPPFNTAGISLSGTPGLPPDAIATPLVPIDMGLDGDFATADERYLIYLQLLPDISSIADGQNDPNLLPTSIGAFAIVATDWDGTANPEAGYSHNNKKVIGSVTIDASFLITKVEQYWTGGNIDDTLFLPDAETNAYTDGTDANDDDIAYSLEYNARGEGQLYGVNDPATNAVSAADYIVIVDDLGGPSGNRPRVRYITPENLNSNYPPTWCDIQTSDPISGSGCLSGIVEDIEADIEHDNIQYGDQPASDIADAKNENKTHDGRYWMSTSVDGTAATGDGGALAGGDTSQKNYATTGNVTTDNNAGSGSKFIHIDSTSTTRSGATDTDNGVAGGIVFDAALLYGGGAMVKQMWAYGV